VIPDLVSTIIPVFNRPAMLQRAVDSVLAQSWRPIEIIICDDGSTDGTPALGAQLAEQYPSVVTYLWNPNRGAGPAREAGRQVARGEFIQYLDSDDTLWPRKFEVQVGALRSRPECGVAYGQIRLCREGQPPADKPHKWSGRDLPTLFPWLLVDRWWNTDAPLWRRTVCDAVGPWSDLRYSQDWEYDARAGALGVRLAYCSEFVTDQHHHATARQTGHGRWLEPKDRVRFFGLLYEHAQRAGVAPNCEEMRHFSRWVFTQARQCGALGDAQASSALLSIAASAAGRKGADLKAYAAAAGLLGWARLGRLSSTLESLRCGHAGRHTLKQSWMEN
jgi:glycosyltransferase involved in cell wall biosynthesis